MNANKDKFIQLTLHPIKFRMFLLSKLPSAFFAGVKVKSINASRAEVTVPYKWFSQNPFNSTYFACLAMAAEMSTGLLAMMNTYKTDPPISMLVTGLEASYYKKATGLTAFTCNQGAAITAIVEQAVLTGEGQSCRMQSTGLNAAGEVVAIFFITWSFKIKRGI